MKKLLIGLSLLASMSSFADNSSCLDHDTYTGLSDRAYLELTINSFQQGYLKDIDSSIELRLDTILQDYDMAADVVDKYGNRTVSKGNISGEGNRIKINRLSFSYEEQDKMKLNKVSAKTKILLSDLNEELYSASNPRYAELKFKFSEFDYLTPNEEIGTSIIPIKSLRRGVLNYNGNIQFNIKFNKGRTKATGTLKVRCN